MRCLLAGGLLLLFGVSSVWAQEVPLAPLHLPGAPIIVPQALPAEEQSSEEPPRWRVDLMSKLSASQAAYSNWTEGGLSTLALTGYLRARADRVTPNWEHHYDVRFGLGIIQQDTFAVRKAADQIHMTGVLEYRGSGFFQTFHPTIAVDLRTQFISGFNYEEDPLELGRTPPVEVSDFLAPGTLTQTIGLTYDSDSWFTQRLSVGTKEVVVIDKSLRPLYNVPPDRVARYEAGVKSTTEISKQLSERIHLSSTLGLFAAFNKANVPDLIWESLLALQFNKWLSVDLEVAALYDRDISEAVQVKEVFSIGASVELL